MKHLFAILIALALMVAPAWALDDPAEGEEEEHTAEAVTVSTLEELQTAVDAAEDGATITIAQTITVNGQRLATEKDITLTRAEGMSGAMIDLWNGGEISGFSFTESGAEYSYTTISIDYCYNSAATINNCNFSKAEGAASYIVVYGNIFNDDPNRAIISGCNFNLSAGRAITTRNHTQIAVNNCIFTGNVANIAWAIDNAGTAVLQDCAIVGNGVQSFSVRNGATMQIENITITRDNRDNKAVFDIFSSADATLSITNDAGEDAVYSLTTKAELELPLTDYSGMMQLVFLTEDEAAAYFAPDEPEDEAPIDNPVDEPQDTPDDPTDDEQEDNPADEQPEQPTDDPQPPETPQDEPQQEQGNDPADTPAEPPARENEPTAPEDQTEDKPAAQEQQEIEQIDDSEQDSAEDNTEDEQTAPEVEEQPQDTTPAEEKPQPQPEQPREYISYTPIYTYHGGGEIIPAENQQEDHTTVAADTPIVKALVCGSARIDTARRVELAGYGDGDLHLEDSLTRAQMATIIYRLLDAATIEQYSDSTSSFVDVPSGAWYAPYVQLISSAGIVQGVGGGKYAPESTVTWAQIVVLLARFVPEQDHALENITCPEWAQDAMQTAVALGWIEDSAEFDAAAEISRAEFAALVNSVLDMVA